jgi:MYXO-CTERM domain-containing protein
MNESFSDIAGTTAKFYFDAKTADFNLGGDIFQKANTYIRYMCKPSMDGMSIDSAAQYKSTLDVHYTSGVMNRAFCRAAKRLSGADPDTGTATVDGVKTASKAWYEANASHWTKSATFMTGCQGVIDAATALKYSPSDISGLGDSWKDVGVTCTYTHVNGFGMTLTPPTATVMAGMPATFTVTTTVASGDTAQSVALTATGLPSGVTATFNPATIMSGATSTLTITPPYDAMLGDITFTVVGTGATATNMATGTLTVTAPPPDLTPPSPPDMASGTGGNGGSGGNGNHGGGSDSGCSMGGHGGPSAGALFFVIAALFLAVRRRTRALALSRQ